MQWRVNDRLLCLIHGRCKHSVLPTYYKKFGHSGDWIQACCMAAKHSTKTGLFYSETDICVRLVCLIAQCSVLNYRAFVWLMHLIAMSIFRLSHIGYLSFGMLFSLFGYLWLNPNTFIQYFNVCNLHKRFHFDLVFNITFVSSFYWKNVIIWFDKHLAVVR